MDAFNQTLLELQMNLSSNIRRLRKVRRLTQEGLALRARVAVRHVQKLEAGQVNITLKTLLRLAVALDVAPDQLLAKRETYDDTP